MDPFAEIEIDSTQLQTSSQKIALPSVEIIGGTADPVRRRFYDMRSMASDNPYTWNDARLFYKQAKFMEDFTDDYNGNAPFSMHYPCFQRMGYERLRTYFSWRTAARRGEFLPVSLSYVFLYVYELLACIGATSPAQALAGLVALRQYDELNDYLTSWIKDFHIYYHLPFDDFTSFNKNFYEENNLDSWNKISNYDIEKSKFFTANDENAKLLRDCFDAAISGISSLCEKKSRRLKDLFVLTGKQEIPWTPFRRALFHPWLNQTDRRVELGGEIFNCKNNEWTTLYAAPYAHNKALAAFIIKKAEACTRAETDFSPKISADPATLIKARTALHELGITIPEIESAIESAITGFFKEKNRVVVNVDIKALERIREESEEITDKLIVEEIIEEKTLGAKGAVSEANVSRAALPLQEGSDALTSDIDVWDEFARSLTEAEATALKMILENEGMSKIKAFADGEGLMLEILVDSINEKALDAIGDNILELSDIFEIYEDYRELISFRT
ncbi:MAG: TerB N-terminal domain-containing protein [Clostridiales bacterium]|jgi:hypothetical protein|nr:TerB N-terminal domain-containing protein [Clostridiales bacterium]